MTRPYPILEFDPTRTAIIEPQAASLSVETPSRAVLCFFYDVIEDLVATNRLKDVGALRSEMGRHPVYLLEHKGKEVIVFHPGVGAPLAAGFLDELISLGVTQFIACGGCGVLDSAHAPGVVMLISSAVRDEGTSYHYLPPEQEAFPHPAAVKSLQVTCDQYKLPYHLVKSWTTDAIYRETVNRRDLRIKQGCEVVEMEAAALFAVAQFRHVKFGQVVYGGDLVVPEGWDARRWDQRNSDRERLFWLAIEAVICMDSIA